MERKHKIIINDSAYKAMDNKNVIKRTANSVLKIC
jgi:hypothetical protein